MLFHALSDFAIIVVLYILIVTISFYNPNPSVHHVQLIAQTMQTGFDVRTSVPLPHHVHIPGIKTITADVQARRHRQGDNRMRNRQLVRARDMPGHKIRF